MSDDQAIAVLALQGDFEAHRRMLSSMGIDSFEARLPEDLERASGLVLPGGESTTIWKFFESASWEPALQKFAQSGRPILGTCAGAILLAREVANPPQKGLGLLDIGVERNAYGRQVDSFEADVQVRGIGAVRAVFIRAPRVERVGPSVEVLAEHDGRPVVVQEGRVIAAAFHPEMAGDPRLHERLLTLAR